MIRRSIAVAVLSLAASASLAQTTRPVRPSSVYDSARKSLVVVRYTWASELGPREMEMPGVVIDASGVVMCGANFVNDFVPLKQITDAKIVVPRDGDDPLELAADFQGRDDRCDLAYFKAAEPHDWTPLAFAAEPVAAGDEVLSVGLLGRSSGYKAVIGRTLVAATTRDGPTALTDGRLAGVGAVVFDEAGRAIGYATAAPTPAAGRRGWPGGNGGPPPAGNTFAPASAFLDELADRPTPGKPVVRPWLGVSDWSGLKSDEAAYYGVKGPAVQLGGVSPDGPLAKAGFKAGQIIVGLDGQPLDRGDGPEGTTTLLRQRVERMKPGAIATFDVVDGKGQPPEPMAVTLAPMPPSANTADRYWADELGLGVRDAVFMDRFARKLPGDARGVVVTLTKPGGPAEAAEVPPDAFVKQVGGTPVGDVKSFADALRQQRRGKPGEPVVLLLNQNGRDATVRIEAN